MACEKSTEEDGNRPNGLIQLPNRRVLPFAETLEME
jgi:hypothetical protein